MNFLTRLSPPEYHFIVHDPQNASNKLLGWPFRKDILEQLIPGSLTLRRAGGRGPDGRSRVVLNLTGVVQHYETDQHRDLRPGRFIRCLNLFFSVLREESNPTHVIPKVMDHQAGKHLAYIFRTWHDAVGDFAFLTYLLGPGVLKGAQCLRDSLIGWLLDNCEIFSSEAPLPISLQFVELCKEDDVFQSALRVLIRSLSPEDFQILMTTRGRIDLPFSYCPSPRIMAYIRRLVLHQGFGPGPHGPPGYPTPPPNLHHPGHGMQTGHFGLVPNWWFNAQSPHPIHPAMHGGFGMGGPTHQFGIGF